MAQNINYFEKKIQNTSKAQAHVTKMAATKLASIERSVDLAGVYTDKVPFKDRPGVSTSVLFDATDSVSAVLKYYDASKKEAVLNFASYKEPGGLFLKGSMAQEEALCHESTLYNVLNTFRDTYYKWNNERKNGALYLNRALYTPEIAFMRDDTKTGQSFEVTCDVITCAAPNFLTAQKYCNVEAEENDKVLYDRCRFVLSVANDNAVNTLILGAYGCGVFGQDAYRVGQIFGTLLSTEFCDCFETVVFACLPGSNFGDLKRGVEEAMKTNQKTPDQGWF